MWKRVIRWSLVVAAAMFASGVAVQNARPLLPEHWSNQVMAVSAGLKLAVAISLLLALGAGLTNILFPRQASPFVMDHRFWLRAVFVMGMVNFLVFVLVANAIGGDAINGQVENGRYFLRNHGVVTEVSRLVFFYSEWHSISLFITHPLALLAAWELNNGQNSN